ncbi:hypothetical protein MetexDRAFT_6061 [Methylorubrum extorquens DSM 13060]|uniref:Uncharacterized protein n=1 Tax=Methylorubrum extorquens DSM 13060 TaxID=882800 RepID=H1KTU8_METEX|nr:hypothetical protein MetexDRAFT_6061 [Methylorubrum extorquens DSM 13060]
MLGVDAEDLWRGPAQAYGLGAKALDEISAGLVDANHVVETGSVSVAGSHPDRVTGGALAKQAGAPTRVGHPHEVAEARGVAQGTATLLAII